MRLRTITASAVMVLASFTGMFTAGTVAAAAATPHAAVSHTSLWWDGATCRAFTEYERYGHGIAFHRMVVDSRHADTYLRSDVALWAHDLHRHASRATGRLDRSYLWDDCNTTGD